MTLTKPELLTSPSYLLSPTQRKKKRKKFKSKQTRSWVRSVKLKIRNSNKPNTMLGSKARHKSTRTVEINHFPCLMAPVLGK